MAVERTELIALKKFPHEGSMVHPGDSFWVPTYKVRLFVKPGLAELAPTKKAKKASPPPVEVEEVAKADDAVQVDETPPMQTYSTRDMQADS